MAEGWSQFLDLLTNNIYFRAGFMWALILIGGGWLIWWVLYRFYVQWLKIRQFFEPIRVPAKTPLEKGPSPASMLIGCMGRMIITLLAVTLLIGVLFWYAYLPGG